MTDVTDDEEDNQHNELNEFIPDVASLDRSSIVGNAALEISRILSDSQNENDQLYEENLDENEELKNIGENQRRRRRDRWEGRKILETLSKNNNLVTNLGLANVSDNNPLCKNGFLVVYSNHILCLGKVITMYEKSGQRHAWVEKLAGFLDNLSYISINIYMQVTHRFSSCENSIGGDITIHITPHEVVYFLGMRSYTNVENHLISVDDETISV